MENNITHFIEVFKCNDKLINGVLCEAKDLGRNLKITQSSASLKTIAVWKIKLKPGVQITNETN